jgi:hypothetical protein
MIVGQQGQATPVPSGFLGGTVAKSKADKRLTTPRSIALLLSELTSSTSSAAHSTRTATRCLHAFVHTCPPGLRNVFPEQLCHPQLVAFLPQQPLALLLRSAGERFPDLLLYVERLRLRPCHTELAVGTCNSILFRAAFSDAHAAQPV